MPTHQETHTDPGAGDARARKQADDMVRLLARIAASRIVRRPIDTIAWGVVIGSLVLALLVMLFSGFLLNILINARPD